MANAAVKDGNMLAHKKILKEEEDERRNEA